MATPVADAGVVRREIRIDASPHTVFAFLIDPTKMVRWMGTEATLDPHPGGAYRVNITGRESVRGEVVEIVPDTRLVFTWGWEDGMFPVPPGASTVEISLEPDGDGTLLRLTHRGLSRDMGKFHAFGWQHAITRLAVAAAGGDPGPDPLTFHRASGPHGRQSAATAIPVPVPAQTPLQHRASKATKPPTLIDRHSPAPVENSSRRRLPPRAHRFVRVE